MDLRGNGAKRTMPSTGEEAPGRCPRDIEELLFEALAEGSSLDHR